MFVGHEIQHRLDQAGMVDLERRYVTLDENVAQFTQRLHTVVHVTV